MSTALRDQIIAAATRRTLAHGWNGITMARLADDVGVSRQTIYNEMGSKTHLAEALARHELRAFLAEVVAGFDAEPADPVRAVRSSVLSVLQYAEESPLIVAIVSSAQGAETDLLPLLTTRPSTILGGATTTICELLAHYGPAVPDSRVEKCVDVGVRSVISHLMFPAEEPEVLAEHLGWMAGRLLFADERAAAP